MAGRPRGVAAVTGTWRGIVLNAVVAAAFVGPGTVTAAASAGSRYGTRLLWALTFSTLACYLLQEASARVTIGSGKDLGACVRDDLRGGPRVRAAVSGLIVAAIAIGCTAYQAGNLLGGAAGLRIAIDLPVPLAVALVTAAAGALLWLGSPGRIARGLTLLVALMGGAFVALALSSPVRAVDVLRDAWVPSWPVGSATVALALLGTTVVPYNLFLGSGVARTQRLPEARLGLAIAIGAGGVVSGAILVAAGGLAGEVSLDALAGLFFERWGTAGRTLFAAGLAGAGLTSAVTAPWAAAWTVRSVVATEGDPRWAFAGSRFRAVWIAVLAIGAGVALVGVRPVPMIVAAQALNGALLPIVAVVLGVLVNDRRRVPPGSVPGPLWNALWAAVVLLCVVLGGRRLLALF